MQKREFRVEYKKCVSTVAALNKWAEMGWDLVTVDGSTAYMRRVTPLKRK